MSSTAAWQRYWFEWRFSEARFTGFRVLFFGLLAFDEWVLMLPRASFHGVGGLELSHLPGLDAWLPTPSTEAFTVSALAGGFLAFVIAAGAARRAAVIALAALYGGTYLWSQVDSYQHHYLIACLLTLACGLPERSFSPAPRRLDPADPPRFHSWALQLVYVQLGLLYFWAGVTKTDAAWLDGWTLQAILDPCSVQRVEQLSTTLGLHPGTLLVAAAWAIMLVEFIAAFIYWVPRLRPLGFLLLPAMHIGIELLGLRIGWFSYYMVALALVLLVPEGLLVRVTTHLDSLRAGLASRLPAPATDHRGLFALLGLVATAGLAFAAPVPARLELAIALILAGALCGLGAPQPRRALVQVAAIGVGIAALHVSGSAALYHGQWASDLQRRGEFAEAAQHFEAATRLGDAGPGYHFQLARAYRKLRRDDEALATLREGVARQRAQLEDAERAVARHLEDADARIALAAAHARLTARSAAMAVLEVSQGAAEDATASRARAESHHSRTLAAVRAVHRLAPCRSTAADRVLWLLQGESELLSPHDWDVRRARRMGRRSADQRGDGSTGTGSKPSNAGE